MLRGQCCNYNLILKCRKQNKQSLVISTVFSGELMPFIFKPTATGLTHKDFRTRPFSCFRECLQSKAMELFSWPDLPEMKPHACKVSLSGHGMDLFFLHLETIILL